MCRSDPCPEVWIAVAAGPGQKNDVHSDVLHSHLQLLHLADVTCHSLFLIPPQDRTTSDCHVTFDPKPHCTRHTFQAEWCTLALCQICTDVEWKWCTLQDSCLEKWHLSSLFLFSFVFFFPRWADTLCSQSFVQNVIVHAHLGVGHVLLKLQGTKGLCCKALVVLTLLFSFLQCLCIPLLAHIESFACYKNAKRL